MATHLATKQRRLFQVLWTQLDRHLLPCLPSGVVLAVSGGPDSRALLEACASWSKRNEGRIVVASIDHGARHEARHEAKLVAMRAKRLGFLAYHEEIVNADESLGEQELRDARYQALDQIAKKAGCQTICTAHHADDDAEGYFMALMGVGGGELGAAMDNQSMRSGLILCRPFLALHKKDLLDALSLSGFTDFVSDRLDEASVGMRAHVRNLIFPDLFKKAPSLKKRLVSFGRHQASQRELIDRLSGSLILWGESHAQVSLDPQPDKALLASALWLILKKWSDNRDLRSSQPTIDALLDDLPPVFAPRLDPISNAFNLKDLSVKNYQFPGVLVTKSSKNIVVKRI